MSGTLEGCTTIVVDDDPHVRAVLQRGLQRAGAVVHVFGSGHEAADAVDGIRPELVLTDLQMPDGDGIAVIRAVRDAPWGKSVAVIVLSGAPDVDIQISALDNGADDFVAKPSMTRLMIARAANLVARHRAEAQTRSLAARLARFVSEPVLRDDTTVDAAAPPVPIDAAILFSDLRGFTATARHGEANALFAALRAVHARQVELVQRHGGYIDKFYGDGMLAIFEGGDRVHRACLTALDIVDWGASASDLGPWSPLPIGVGVHVGRVLRGTLGTADRAELTVIGHDVNVAARLCGVARPLEVLVSQAALDQAGAGIVSTAVRVVELRGLGEGTRLHVLGRGDPP